MKRYAFLLVNINTVYFLKFLSGEHTDGIPGQFCTDLGTYLTAGTFVEYYLNGGYWNIVFFLRNDFNAINRTKRDAYPASGAAILVNYRHQSWLFLLHTNLLG